MKLEPLLVKQPKLSALFRHALVATVKLAGSGTLGGIKMFFFAALGPYYFALTHIIIDLVT